MDRQELVVGDEPLDRVAPVRLREVKAPLPEVESGTRVSPSANEDRSRPRYSPRRLLLALGPLVVLVAALFFYLSGGRYVSTDNAYVKAAKLGLSTDVSGIVADVPVREGQKVAKGDVLFRLDDAPYRIALAGAEAQLGTTRNDIAVLQATYRQNLAQIEQAQTDVEFYQTAYQRQRNLASGGVSSQSALDQAKRDVDSARDKVLVAQRQADAALAQLGGSVDAPVETNPRFLQARAQVDAARRNLDHTVLRAPANGVVTNVSALQVGAYLPAAQLAFNFVADDEFWVEANPKETDLTYLRAGNPAVVTVDAYPNREWHAHVASVSPAAGSEFSVLPAQNASGNWVKVVQRIPIRVSLDPMESAPQLSSGMSAFVEIDTGHTRSFAGLFHSLGGMIGL